MTTSRHRWLAHLLSVSQIFHYCFRCFAHHCRPGTGERSSAIRPSAGSRATGWRGRGGEPGQQKQLWPRSLAVSRAQRNERVPEAPQEGRPPGHNGRTAADIQEVAAHNDAQALLAASADARDIARRPGRLQ